MPVNQNSRKKVLAVALLTVALSGIAVQRLWPSSTLAACAIILLVAAMLLLLKQAAKWQLFSTTPFIPHSNSAG